ncbi:hypothetical protein O3P69_017529 [Scylla paramamosain]|uniref:Uncharacterized protein n=1 Tax=Scylla paramamosain TaxID=85552 RepID=A0AAW0TWB9_SCYPA
MEGRQVRARVVYAWLALLSFSPAWAEEHTSPSLTTPSLTSRGSFAPQRSTTSSFSTLALQRTEPNMTTSALETSSTLVASYKASESHASVLKMTVWQSSEVEHKKGGFQAMGSGAFEASMKDCPENQFGFVVAAGDVEACRIELVELEECDPSQAVMTLVSQEFGHQNGSTQSHQASVVGEGVVEVYLKEDLPGHYRLICIDTHTFSILAAINVGSFQEPNSPASRIPAYTHTVSPSVPVLDLEDFGCRFYNWEVLECTWTRPYNPAQSSKEDYFPFLCVSDQCQFCECVEGTCLETSCMNNCCGWNGNAYHNTAVCTLSRRSQARHSFLCRLLDHS